ncbi:MAG: hypothetical protein HY904_15450 [Deltaproteobacteria bacterium]|nr:hypothetical protein [Deltaproteobacteria bacterium]
MSGRMKIGEMMLKAGLIDQLQLNAGLAHQRQWGGKLGSVLVELGFVDEDLLWKGLARQLGLPRAELATLAIHPAIIQRIPVELCEKHTLIPLGYREESKTITVATAEPNNTAALDEITFMTRLRTAVALAPETEIKWAIRRHYRGDGSPCPPLRHKKATVMDVDADTDNEDMKVTDMSGKTLMKKLSDIRPPEAPPPPPPPPPPPAPAYARPPPGAFVPQQGFGAPVSVVALAPGAQLTPELAAVKAELEKGNRFLKSIIEMCITRGVFTQQEYMERLKRS